jgi:nucleotide-binding universal stress UspA family protein
MVSKTSCTIDRGVPANDRSVSWVNKKILVATDLSPGADLAVRRAVMLGKRHGASVTLAHVVDEKASQRLIDEEANRARRLLEDWYGPPGERPEFELEIRIETGSPAEIIGEMAAAEGPDLLVFGEPRKRLFADLVSGATMERAVRASGLPALTVNLPPRRPYRKILVGLSLSEASRHAIAKAHELDLLNASDISLVHAFTVLGKARMVFSDMNPDDVEDHVARAAMEARGRVREFLSGSGLPAFRRTIHVAEGEPHVAVERAASSLSAELVVIGAPAESGLSRLIRGSVAGEILRRVRCDVLVVPAPTVAPGVLGQARRKLNSVSEPVWSVAS